MDYMSFLGRFDAGRLMPYVFWIACHEMNIMDYMATYQFFDSWSFTQCIFYIIYKIWFFSMEEKDVRLHFQGTDGEKIGMNECGIFHVSKVAP